MEIHFRKPGVLLDLHGTTVAAKSCARIGVEQLAAETGNLSGATARRIERVSAGATRAHLFDITAVMRQVPGEQYIDEATQTVKIKRRAVALPLQHLWREIEHRADERLEQRRVRQILLRQSEVCESHMTIVIEQAVLGFQVTI